MWFIPLASSAAGAAVLLYLAFVRPPDNRPADFLKTGRARTTTTVVACVGDSTTHASLSGDYVAMLRDRLGRQGHEFINAGVNGDTSTGLVRRIGEVVACQPDAVTILIGVNEARAKDCALDAFRDNLATVLLHLSAGTRARIALLSLPPLGEDLASEPNRCVDQFNEVIASVAATHGATCLPLHDALVTLLRDNPPPRPLPYRFRFDRMLANAFRRYVRRRSWDEIAAHNGLVFSIDQLHLSDRGATAVADLIADWLTRSAVPPPHGRAAS